MTAPTPDEVLAAVGAAAGFSRGQLLGRENFKGLPAARRAAMYLLQRHCGLTAGQIARALDYTNGNSIYMALGKARDLMAESPAFRELVARAAARLPGLPAAPREDPRNLPKRRKCLMCGKRFESGHAGERICASCKNTTLWKSGNDCTVFPG